MTRVPEPESLSPDNASRWAQLPANVAIPRLLDQHGGRLLGLATRLCGTPEEAEDLVQETFLRAYRNWHQFTGRSDPISWLYRIAAHTCQRMHRRRAGEPQHLQSFDDLLPFGGTAMAEVGDGSELSEAIRREGIERIGEAIAELPLPFRLCVVLKEIIGLTVEQVAEVLGIKPGTVKTRLHRARLRLRDALDAALPHRDGPPPAYPRQVCLDLLRGKLEAMDRGVPYPVESEVVCERCHAVFATLDLTSELCAQLGIGELPADLRAALLAEMK